jgi:hypothetical protein
MNGWLVCAEEDESGVDLGSFMQKDATSGCLCESGDRSEKTCRRLWEAIRDVLPHSMGRLLRSLPRGARPARQVLVA